jgi:hypothetical protein
MIDGLEAVTLAFGDALVPDAMPDRAVASVLGLERAIGLQANPACP